MPDSGCPVTSRRVASRPASVDQGHLLGFRVGNPASKGATRKQFYIIRILTPKFSTPGGVEPLYLRKGPTIALAHALVEGRGIDHNPETSHGSSDRNSGDPGCRSHQPHSGPHVPETSRRPQPPPSTPRQVQAFFAIRAAHERKHTGAHPGAHRETCRP